MESMRYLYTYISEEKKKTNIKCICNRWGTRQPDNCTGAALRGDYSACWHWCSPSRRGWNIRTDAKRNKLGHCACKTFILMWNWGSFNGWNDLRECAPRGKLRCKWIPNHALSVRHGARGFPNQREHKRTILGHLCLLWGGGKKWPAAASISCHLKNKNDRTEWWQTASKQLLVRKVRVLSNQ